MSNFPFDPLLLAIAAPFTVAVLIALGLPKRIVTKLAYAGFAIPALVALWAWCAVRLLLKSERSETAGEFGPTAARDSGRVN